MKKSIIGIVLLLSLAMIMQWQGVKSADESDRFHSEHEIQTYLHLMRSLPEGHNALFAGSGACVQCHGSDPEGIASIIGEGIDVNVVDDWRATMMANSAKDPFWRAKVSHEVMVNPGLQEKIETTCTACHAPLGHFNAFHLGSEHYSIAEMVQDSLALDGVSCVACHQISPDGLGETFSGQVNYDTNKVAYGPYISPLSSPMIEFANYVPVYSEHINDAGICASCHTLITETVDMSGNLTGNSFVEQATYHEWLNSVYNNDVTCQSCHLPRINDEVQLVAGYFTEPRTPYGLHHLVGANTYMVELMRDYRQELGIDATVAQFDSVLARTTRMLQQQTLDLSMQLVGRDQDTARFELNIVNKAGHKFPSGYPARLAFVEFVLQNDNGDTLFASGLMNEEKRILERDEPWELHYDIIRQPQEVQVYEMVMLDIEGNATTVLERAWETIKDNRLPPIGFTDFHFAYDTTQIKGLAETDLNFNRDGATQGTGGDILSYFVPVFGYTGNITASAKVYYQSLPPRWLDEMFEFNSLEIDTFRTMYESKSPDPVLIASAVITDGPTGVKGLTEQSFTVSLTQTGEGWFFESGALPVRSVRMFSISGQLVHSEFPMTHSGIFIPQASAGIYLVEVVAGDERLIKKVIVP